MTPLCLLKSINKKLTFGKMSFEMEKIDLFPTNKIYYFLYLLK